MAEAGMAVATKLMLVSRALTRLSELEAGLCKEIDQSAKLDRLLAGGFVYTPDDPNSAYDLCVAVDGVLAECLSLFEVIRNFTIKFSRKILWKRISKQDFYKLLEQLGLGGKWLEELDASRNFFLHESAPWPAFQIESRSPLVCSLIVLKTNVRDLSDPSTFISKRELAEMTRGLTQAVWGVQKWLDEAVSKAEAIE